MSPLSSLFATKRTKCWVGLLSVLLLCVYHNASNGGSIQPLVGVARETSSTSTSSSAITSSRWTQSTATAAAAAATTKTGLPTNLPLSDINVVVLTDVHSWIGGHGAKEGDALDADYGDVLSFVQILKDQMLYANNPGPFPGDLWFVMNGDWIDGTGLAMNGDASNLVQLLEKMPWDAVNIGNHELYHNAVISTMTQIGGFVEWWGSRYLTSNVVHSSTDITERKPIGNHYRILKGHHANVLTFGFLFNMQDADSLVTVEQVQSVVQSAWFRTALHEPDIDAILVLAHMDVQDPLVAVILQAIRQQEGMQDMPVQFITGHTHQRAHDTCDHLCSSFEAGRYLDTVGFVSFPKKDNVAALLRSAAAATAQANSEGSSPSGTSSGGGAYAGSGYDTSNGDGSGGDAGYGGASNGGGSSNGGPSYGGPTGSAGSNTGDTGATEDTTGYNTGGATGTYTDPSGGRALVDRILQTEPSDGGDGVTWPVAPNDGDTAFPPMGGDADDSDNTNPNPVEDGTGSDPTNTPNTEDTDPNTAAANPFDGGSATATPGSNSPNGSGTGSDTGPAPAPVAAPAPTPVDLLFHHIFINASKAALRARLGVSSLETDDGLELSKFINRVQTEMGLKDIVGCTPQSYYLNHGLHQLDSLWRLFRDGVVPRVFSTRHPRAVLFLGKGGLRYDLLAGDVAMDEVIAVSPFNETMYIWKDIPGPVIAKLNATLNFISTETSPDANSVNPGTTTGTSTTMVNRSIHRDMPELPEYILAPAKQPFIVDNFNITYDLIIDQFEMKFVGEELNKLYPAGDALPYLQHTTTSMWLEYFTGGGQDCNIQGTGKGSSGHHSSYRPGGGSGSGEATEADIMRIWMAFIAVLVVMLMGAIYARQRATHFQAAMRERQRATFDAVHEYETENNNNNYTDEEASSDDDFDAEFV